MATDLVIILSTDWVASTATRARIGEETADVLQELHDTLLRRVIAAADGHVVKHSGDGVLATFHSATAALGAAVKILEDFAAHRASQDAIAPIDIRIGLAAGDVKHQTGDIFGMPVIEAVRLQSAARPNEILCSDLVRVLSQGRGGFDFEAAGALELKGLPSPVHAFRVRAAELAMTSTRLEPVHAAAPRAPKARVSRAAIVLAVALAFAIVLIVADRFRDEPVAPVAEATPSTGEPAAAATRSGPPPNSIAVIPFINLSPKEEDAYFAVGIHEEILNQLTKLGSLRVVARTTVQRYAATDKAVSAIARELNVETVMEGSVRYADGRVLVTTQLIDGATDTHLWSESYEREFSNIFAIQSDIALAVARAMEAELLPAERARIERAPTDSLPAYELYLSAIARDGRQTREDVLLGLEELDRAIALDPQFSLAWALKANLSTVAPFLDPQRTAEHLATGAQAARTALDIDPLNGGAYAALGFNLFQVQDWQGSETAFRRALELNAPLGDMAAYSVLQLSVGDFAYAREILQEAREALPQNPTALGFLMTANALLGDWPAAVAQYELGQRLFTPWTTGSDSMLHLLVARGELEAARAVSAVHPVNVAMVSYLGRPFEARAELRRMNADPAFGDPVAQRTIAIWAASYGDPALALEAIRSSVTRQGGNALYVWFPQFREARQRPEFKALLRDLGIVGYWQEFGWQAVCRPLEAGDFVCD